MICLLTLYLFPGGTLYDGLKVMHESSLLLFMEKWEQTSELFPFSMSLLPIFSLMYELQEILVYFICTIRPKVLPHPFNSLQQDISFNTFFGPSAKASRIPLVSLLIAVMMLSFPFWTKTQAVIAGYFRSQSMLLTSRVGEELLKCI